MKKGLFAGRSLGGHWERCSDDRGCGGGQWCWGGLWFGETRSRERALETEGKVHHHWDGIQESLLFIYSSSGDTINRISERIYQIVLSAKRKIR